MDARGRRKLNPQPGERNGLAKLNEQAALAIRFARARGVHLETLAAIHGVTFGVISGITTGHGWRHVGGPRTVDRRFKSKNEKLDAAAVAEIRRLAATGRFLQREIAARFGVTEGTVRYVLSGRGWKHIPEVQPCA